MHSIVMLALTVVSLVVGLIDRERICRADILLPGILIALIGGVPNVISVACVQGISPTPFMYVYVVGFSLLVTCAGLCLAEKAGLPGLWPLPPAQSTGRKDLASGVPSRPLLLCAGTLIGVAVGAGLWRVGLRGAPDTPAFLQALRNLSPNKTRLCIGLLVVQSGFMEEPMYRLFAMSAIVKGLNAAGMTRRLGTVSAVLMSALAFAAIPTHNPVVSFLVGLLFGAAYLRLGLVPTIVAHCVTNAVQLPLLIGLRCH